MSVPSVGMWRWVFKLRSVFEYLAGPEEAVKEDGEDVDHGGLRCVVYDVAEEVV